MQPNNERKHHVRTQETRGESHAPSGLGRDLAQPEPEGRVFYSTTFSRNYRDEAGNWKSSDNFSANELLLLAKVADLAHSEDPQASGQ